MPRSPSPVEGLPQARSAGDRQSALAQLLLVCADEMWAHRAREALRSDGFDVEIDPDGTDITAWLSSYQPDVVGLDLALPGGLGVTLCGYLRSRTTLTLFAVGPRASEAGILAALAAGADTFVAKEASSREFVARMRALLRRFPPRPATADAVLVCGPVEFDPRQRRATVAGKRVDLGDVGLDLLEALLRKPGRVVSRAELLAICGGGANDDRVLELHVRRLRERLESGQRERWISAVRGVGFRFDQGSEP